MQLLPQVIVNKDSSHMENAMCSNLTELSLDFSFLEYAEGFGAAEMTMIFRYLRLYLYNLQTLRLRFSPMDEEDLESDEWYRLVKGLKKVRFPRLMTVAIDIGVPAAWFAEFNASVSAS